jgi:hypothetical protein
MGDEPHAVRILLCGIFRHGSRSLLHNPGPTQQIVLLRQVTAAS